MKQFFWGGGDMPFRLQHKTYDLELKAYSPWPIAFITIFCVLFSGLSVSPALAQGPEGLNSLRPVSIGDILPEAFWQQRLKIYTADGDSSYISLADYRNKLLVLDF